MLNSKIHSENKSEIFAKGLNFYKIFWVFFIGCIFGVVVETLWCILTLHRYESRSGLIYGPFNLVYGVGAVAITLSLYWIRNRSNQFIFVGGFFIGGVYEYLCSLFQQIIFGTVSWEYSKTVLNIQGRTSLLYCVFWGGLSLIWIKIIYPKISNIIEKVPNNMGVIITWFLILFMIFDSSISGAAVYRGTQRHCGVSASSSVDIFLDKHYPDSMLKQIYPNMMYVRDGCK